MKRSVILVIAGMAALVFFVAIGFALGLIIQNQYLP